MTHLLHIVIFVTKCYIIYNCIFFYLYIETTCSYIYFIIFKSSYCILQIFLLYTVICLYFIMHLKAMHFFLFLKWYLKKYVVVHSIAFIILNNAFLCVLFHFPYWLWLFQISEKLRGHHAWWTNKEVVLSSLEGKQLVVRGNYKIYTFLFAIRHFVVLCLFLFI